MGGRNRLPGKKLLKIEVEPTKEGNRTVTIAVEVIYLYYLMRDKISNFFSQPLLF